MDVELGKTVKHGDVFQQWLSSRAVHVVSYLHMLAPQLHRTPPTATQWLFEKPLFRLVSKSIHISPS